MDMERSKRTPLYSCSFVPFRFTRNSSDWDKRAQLIDVLQTPMDGRFLLRSSSKHFLTGVAVQPSSSLSMFVSSEFIEPLVRTEWIRWRGSTREKLFLGKDLPSQTNNWTTKCRTNENRSSEGKWTSSAVDLLPDQPLWWQKRMNPRRRGIRHRIERFPLPSSSLDPREDIVVLRSAQRLEEEWATRLRQSNSSSNSNVPLERQQRKISLNQRRSSPAGQAIQISIGPIPFKWKRRRKDRQTNSSRADTRTLTIISVAKGKDISPKSLHRRHTETVAREFNHGFQCDKSLVRDGRGELPDQIDFLVDLRQNRLSSGDEKRSRIVFSSLLLIAIDIRFLAFFFFLFDRFPTRSSFLGQRHFPPEMTERVAMQSERENSEGDTDDAQIFAKTMGPTSSMVTRQEKSTKFCQCLSSGRRLYLRQRRRRRRSIA